MEQSSAAEQRAFAVAKLKRAASLPRMKDGRRPPMHVEAVSEGEKSQMDDRSGVDRKDDDSPALSDQAKAQDSAPPTAETEPKPEDADLKEPTKTPVVEETVEESVVEKEEGGPSPAQKKRRRSRSRSRGSKDLKAKIRAAAPSPLPLHQTSNESSQDEDGIPSPPVSPPPVISPRPHRFDTGTSRVLETSLHPGTTPPTPMLPTLEALQKGLFRSNSASASSGVQRMMAMAKLTGEPFDPTGMSSPPPPAGKLTRNNTVAGGERMAARALLFHRLGERINTDAEQTSGGEEQPIRSPTPTKRRRRRSRRNSSRASTVVDDREPPSTTPNTPQVPASPLLPMNQFGEPTPPRPPLPKVDSFEYETPLGRRGVVIEDLDDDDVPQQNTPVLPGLPHTPIRSPAALNGRALHMSGPSSPEPVPTVGIPIYLSSKHSLKGDGFPTSPFATPLREKAYLEDEDELVAYEETRRDPRPDPYDREISWIAEPVESRIPVHDEDEDEEEEEHEDDNEDNEHEDDGDDEDDTRDVSQVREASEAYHSPRTSVEAKSLLVERETSPEATSRITPSPASAAALSQFNSLSSDVRSSDDYTSARLYSAPTPATPTFEPATPNEYPEWEGQRMVVTDVTPKRSEGGYWERVKNTFTRTGSQNGRRSRTNSIGLRQARDNTDSSVSRESGASLASAKTDKGDGTFAYQQTQGAAQTQNSSPASASVLSLAPHAPKGGVSPIPAASNADLLKYADAKLFPFPGMMELEKQRTRAKGLLNSASTPDIVLGMDQPMASSGSSNLTTRSPEMFRDRKLSHQVSDTRLLARYNLHSPPMMSAAVSSTSTDYFSIPSPQSTGRPQTPTQSGSLKLPTTREGVKKWLTAKKLFSSSSGTSTPSIPMSTTTSQMPEPKSTPDLKNKPSLSDFLIARKEPEVVDWEDVGSEKSRGATSNSGSTLRGKRETNGHGISEFTRAVDDAFGINSPNKLGPSSSYSPPSVPDTPMSEMTSDTPSSLPSPPELNSTTPDPQSSMDEYTTRSTSASFSTLSSHPVVDYTSQEPQSSTTIDRIDELLGRPKGSPFSFSVDDPPRKLMLSSPVFQVVNSNTVKDRFLFLFNDILIIAKPVIQDQDSLLDPTKLTILDRRFLVKSVVQLKHLRLRTEREDNNAKAHMSGSMKHGLIRSFVHQFSKDPDHAIAALFEKARTRDDPIGLGQLMFRTLDLDRARLGDYLSRRTSKLVLKAYVDGFGFLGLRVDRALRVFLQSVNIPSKSSAHFNPFEYLLDAFASRWYEANSTIVAYDKDLAVKLVRAIVQLNEVLHGGIGQEPGVSGYQKRNVIARDFIEAFRRYDLRGLVSDELLEGIYTSLRKERLTQARNPANQGGPPDSIITVKRGLPSRLTYRVQSEPIILRIPQPDTQLSIQLFGQDLTFDPPVLNFGKSPEASFRVTGTSLGPKNIIMLRSGPNALCYSGLPQSSVIMVERAFMRNTFQIAFADVHGERRRYMFSVDDPVLRHQWAMSLKRQVDVAASNWEVSASDPGISKFHLAAESLAFKVLQESLLGLEDADRGRFNASLSSTSSPPLSINGQLYRFDSPRKGMGFGASLHARSKSRSQVYHQSMAGQMEVDLEAPTDDDTDTPEISIQPQRVWKGQDIELLCRQNSSIANILSYLHVGSPSSLSQDHLGNS